MRIFEKNMQCKKGYRLKIFPARESLVSDIPARDGKTTNLFYSVVDQIHIEY